jgi:hypothetical protein
MHCFYDIFLSVSLIFTFCHFLCLFVLSSSLYRTFVIFVYTALRSFANIQITDRQNVDIHIVEKMLNNLLT